MKLKSFLNKFFLGGELIDKVESLVNGEILVYEDIFSKRRMQVGRVSQSGGLVVGIWKRAIKEILKLKIKVNSCLILGLGAGNAAELVVGKWPMAKIVGVDLDPKVIEIGKKYFKLSQIENLKIIVGEAVKTIKEGGIKSTFDLVIVDLYLGEKFPQEAESEIFLNSLKKMTSTEGVVVFNRFYWGKYQKQAIDFQKKLANIFPHVWSKKTYSNILLFASLS